MTSAANSPGTARVVLVGAHGHGGWHLANLRRLQSEGTARLVGVCDLVPVADRQLTGFDDVHQSASLAEMLTTVRPDIVVIATPIHTHRDLALLAADAGVHVLLEKPPAPTLQAYHQLVAGVRAAGVSCQVGFQSLGSAAVRAAAALVRGGALGAVHGISAAGAWQRDSTYYGRARWAGQRTLDGIDVVDGALTNPFAHALATALRVDGTESDELSGGVDGVELELWHAYPIESDDTSCLRLTTARGTTVTVAVTLCAAQPSEPYLVIHGERGRAILWYTRDVLKIESPDGVLPLEPQGRTDLLENLIAHLDDPGVPLLVPLPATRAFMQGVEAVRRAPAPQQIGAEYLEVSQVDGGAGAVTWGGDSASAPQRRTLPGIEDLVTASAQRLALFSELDAPWAVAR